MKGALQNKVACITGASRGIGEAVARRYAQEGAKLALISRTGETLKEVTQRIKSDGGEVLSLAADVSMEDEIVTAVKGLACNVRRMVRSQIHKKSCNVIGCWKLHRIFIGIRLRPHLCPGPSRINRIHTYSLIPHFLCHGIHHAFNTKF